MSFSFSLKPKLSYRFHHLQILLSRDLLLTYKWISIGGIPYILFFHDKTFWVKPYKRFHTNPYWEMSSLHPSVVFLNRNVPWTPLWFRITSDWCKGGIPQQGFIWKWLHGITQKVLSWKKRTYRMPPIEIHLWVKSKSLDSSI